MSRRVLVPILAILTAACGTTQFPSSARTTQIDPRSASGARSTPTTTRPAARALNSLVPSGNVLGPEWEDEGDQPSSLDLTSPPPSCALYTKALDERVDTLIHEFSFLPTADGNYEQGHIAMTAVRATSASAVSDQLAAVARPEYARCAADTAVRWFDENMDGIVDGVSEHPIPLALTRPDVLWRVTIANHTTNGATAHDFSMDIGYLGSGNILVKIRITSCGCRPPIAGDGPLLPGESDALARIASRLSPGGTTA